MRRSRFDLMADILEACRREKLKTHIMYRCNLSYKHLMIYLKLLMKLGLVQTNSNKYEVTEKGFRFLEAYKQLRRLT